MSNLPGQQNPANRTTSIVRPQRTMLLLPLYGGKDKILVPFTSTAILKGMSVPTVQAEGQPSRSLTKVDQGLPITVWLIFLEVGRRPKLTPHRDYVIM